MNDTLQHFSGADHSYHFKVFNRQENRCSVGLCNLPKVKRVAKLLLCVEKEHN